MICRFSLWNLRHVYRNGIEGDIPGCMAPGNSGGRSRVIWVRTRREAGEESWEDLDKLAQDSVVVVH